MHKPREYQQKIYKSILKKGNSLVVLPTGLGKTLIAILLINKLKEKGNILFLTPTKPLAKQHQNTILTQLDGLNEEEVVLVTGEITPKKRKEKYISNIVIATPQTIRNDLMKNIFSLEDFSLIIFDEAHRAVGNYAYTNIAKKSPEKTLLVGLTASPGGSKKKINEILANLKINNIEMRTKQDKDVLPYVQKTKLGWIFVQPTKEIIEIKTALSSIIKQHNQILKKMSFNLPLISKGRFIEYRKRILSIKHPMKYTAIMHYSIVLHSLHLQELIETQGPYTTDQYIKKLEKNPSKSARILLSKPEMFTIKKILSTNPEHPKIPKLLSLLLKYKGKKAIVFVQYRAQIEHIISKLLEQGISARPFMGKRNHFTKKQQEQTIQEFRENKFNILVSSSIGEEGLDIPSVDIVIFYEPIPSEIRTIQRRGRTGRLDKGEVCILITKGTRDEYYYWASQKKEKKMHSILKKFSSEPEENKSKKTKTKKNTKQLDITSFL